MFTDRAVEYARIALLSQTNETVATVYSEADGAFQIVAPGPGTFVISIIRIGYRPSGWRPVTLLPADTVDVAYYMQALPVPLDPVTVEAESYVRYLEEAGFYRRQRMGFGYHVDHASFRNHRRVTLVSVAWDSADSNQNPRLVGAWIATAWEYDGNPVADPQRGLLVFTEGNYSMMFVLGETPRPRYSGDVLTEAETISEYNSFVANSGRGTRSARMRSPRRPTWTMGIQPGHAHLSV